MYVNRTFALVTLNAPQVSASGWEALAVGVAMFFLLQDVAIKYEVNKVIMRKGATLGGSSGTVCRRKIPACRAPANHYRMSDK